MGFAHSLHDPGFWMSLQPEFLENEVQLHAPDTQSLQYRWGSEVQFHFCGQWVMQVFVDGNFQHMYIGLQTQATDLVSQTQEWTHGLQQLRIHELPLLLPSSVFR
jgi:hypothetical protein